MEDTIPERSTRPPFFSFISRRSLSLQSIIGIGNRKHSYGKEEGSDIIPSDGSGSSTSSSAIFPVPESIPTLPPQVNLSSQEEEKYCQVLVYFQTRNEYPISLAADETKERPLSDWEKLRLLSKESILRYLRASHWDPDEATRRLSETIAWRREYGMDYLDPNEMLKEAKCGKEYVSGYDNRARPLHYMRPHLNDTPESPRQMQFAVWLLEICIDLMPPGVEQITLLIDFDNKSRNPTSIANAKYMLYILQNHYVERLGSALCINVPWLFKVFWSALQPFVDAETRAKCTFNGGDILQQVPFSQLCSHFGGGRQSCPNFPKYWSELVRLSQERRKAMLAIFRNDCGSVIGASEWIILGGNQDDQDNINKELKVQQEVYLTPLDVVNLNPLERRFSVASSVMTRTFIRTTSTINVEEKPKPSFIGSTIDLVVKEEDTPSPTLSPRREDCVDTNVDSASSINKAEKQSMAVDKMNQGKIVKQKRKKKITIQWLRFVHIRS